MRVFLGRDDVQDGRQFFRFCGTGFLVAAHATNCPSGFHQYLVTARHVAVKLAGRPFGVRVNTTDGFAKTVDVPSDARWWFHPTHAESVDVAVMPWPRTADEDTFPVPASAALTDETITDKQIGPGDAVFTFGLFSRLEGRSRNVPIVRTGNVAMMPTEMLPRAQIGDWVGEIEAYLVEARSIGGLSGSPVFVRETLWSPLVPVVSRKETTRSRLWAHGRFHFMGLMHGHWEVFSYVTKTNPTLTCDHQHTIH